MISNSHSSYKHISLEQINTASISLIHEEINNNDEELEKIKNLVEESYKNGHKIPLLAIVFLLFYNSGKTTLKKSEAYALMEKETQNYKNKIISSPTERYCMINHKNFKSKIKDILKKKKWFSRKVNDDGEIEYTLNPSVVQSVAPKINTYIKVLIKNEFLFKTENEEQENAEEEKKEKNNNENEENTVDNTEKKKGKKKKRKLVKKKDILAKKKKSRRRKKSSGLDILSDEKIENISSNESEEGLSFENVKDKEEEKKEENKKVLHQHVNSELDLGDQNSGFFEQVDSDKKDLTIKTRSLKKHNSLKKKAANTVTCAEFQLNIEEKK